MTTRVIHVGLGGWGGDWARRAIPDVADVTVVGLADPNTATLDAVRQDLRMRPEQAFTSLTDALATVDADAVVITAPAATHAPLALEALDAGKHVLIEKPFANTLEDAAEVVRRGEQLGLHVHVSQNYRWYPAPHAVQQLLQQDTVGELTAITIDFRQWDNDLPYAEHPHYRFPNAMINDMAIHHFDLLRMITGRDAVRVYAQTTLPRFSKYDDEAVATITIEMDDGVTVSYRGSWLSRAPRTAWAGEWSVQGELGELRFQSRHNAPNDITGDTVTVRQVGDHTARSMPLPDLAHTDRQGALHAFASAIAGNSTAATTGRDNLRSLALMAAATRSAASRQPEPIILPG